MSDPAGDPVHDATRTVVFVVGAGRSGTSTLAGLLRRHGLRVPAPEVPPDATNPRGFGEPQWVVDLHDRLLGDVVVQVGDARPDAWYDTGEACLREPARIRVTEWLTEQLAHGDDLVLKDPRLGWFLPLWRAAAVRAGARATYATMLRPPAEVAASREHHYANRLGAAHLTASWLNMHLHAERATRPAPADAGAEAGAEASGGPGASGAPRVFVRYADLLEDWVVQLQRVGEVLGLDTVLGADAERVRDGHRFVDPSLRRITHGLDDLDLPPRLRELAEESWTALGSLADPGGDVATTHAALDDLRCAYVDLYAEAEAISRSSVVAARRARRPPPRPAAPAPPVDPSPDPAGPGSPEPGAVRRVARALRGDRRDA